MTDLLTKTLLTVSSFKPYVFLPVIILLFALYFRITWTRAIHSSLMIGIGFLGIFIVFGYFIESIEPAIRMLITRTGVELNVLDVGWTPLSAIAWANKLAPIYVVTIFALNLLLIFTNLTKTLNIDIWNYWHFIMAGTLVYESTQNVLLALIATIIAALLSLKFADWSAPVVERLIGIPGVAITTFSGQAYLPAGVIGDRILDRVPMIKHICINAETLKNKLGIIGEPIMIGFIIGTSLGISAGYDVKNILQLGVEFAGVTYLIPLMSGIIANGLMPISEGIKAYSQTKFTKTNRQVYMGLHYAVVMKNDSMIVSGIILMPIALVLAFVLPGANFIPLGELANISSAVFMIVVVTRGNLFRTFLLGIPLIAGKIYVASHLATELTKLYQNPQLGFLEVDGLITSFLEGGNLLRFWIVTLCEGNKISLLLLPVIIMMLVSCYHWAKKTQRDLINNTIPLSKESKKD